MILLTGANGFVGASLYARLCADGRRVLPLGHSREFLIEGSGFSLDLNNPAHYDLLAPYCPKCDTLIHLAGRIDIRFEPSIDGDYAPLASAQRVAGLYADNVTATARLLDFCLEAGIRHVIFASSQTVYGLPASERVDEETPLAPLEYYAATKVAGEKLIELWARGHGRKATILRFPGVWGEERSSGLVYALCRAALDCNRVRAGATFPLPLDVLHRADVVDAFVAGLERPGAGCRVYNIATGEPCSIHRLADDIAGLIPGCEVEIFGVPQPRIALDCERARAELGWVAHSRRERLGSYLDNLRGVIADARGTAAG